MPDGYIVIVQSKALRFPSLLRRWKDIKIVVSVADPITDIDQALKLAKEGDNPEYILLSGERMRSKGIILNVEDYKKSGKEMFPF